MSENLEIARRANELFNAGEIEAAFALIHPEVEFRDLQHAPDLPEAVSGRDAVGVVLAHWIDAYDELTVEALDFVEVDAWVIADVRWRGRGRGSDVVVDVRQADACRVEDGRIVEWVVGYPDMASALKAVGVEE